MSNMNVLMHNMQAMFSNRQLGITTNNRAKSSEKLSSGYKINRAADDAAGLAISEKLRHQIRGLNQASKNCQDGISLVQVADGALNETQDILQRMNELTIKSANGTNTAQDRQAIQEEMNDLREEIDRIANSTSFNADIYPLKSGIGGETAFISDDSATEDADIDPLTLSEDSYPGETVNILDSSSIDNYSSYVDPDGKKHYVLGSGTFQIVGLTNSVFDVSGDVCIENTDVSNVSINCDEGTVLNIKNVSITNERRASSATAIGSAISFRGSDNILNVYGANYFKGGVDDYAKYTDTEGLSHNSVCAAINVNGNTVLNINGTSTSLLKAYGAIDENERDNSSIKAGSVAIGNDNNSTGGNIIINSGTIVADSAYWESKGAIYADSITINGGSILATAATVDQRTASVAIGSWNNPTININGGVISARSNFGCAIGSTFNSEANINILGGSISASTSYAEATIGVLSHGRVNILISGGNIKANNDAAIGGVAIGTGSYPSGGTIDIREGNIEATSSSTSFAAIGAKYGNVDVYVEGEESNTTGTPTNGRNVYVYTNSNIDSNSSSGAGVSEKADTASKTRAVSGITIQAGAYHGEEVEIPINFVDATASGIGINNVDVSTREGALNAIEKIKNALDTVSGYRTYFGAVQNRMEHTIKNLDNVVENTQDAESRIRDTDIAEEVLRFTKEGILQQAGQSILAQTNQNRQGILSLLS